MRVHIIVTDDDGKTFEGDVALAQTSGEAPVRPRPEKRRPASQSSSSRSSALDFLLPPRAFIRRHARGLTGPQKFTMLLARLADGKPGVAVGRSSIERTWNKMTGPMGGRFNSAYSTRAKDNGWVDTPKPGSYALLPGWADAHTKK